MRTLKENLHTFPCLLTYILLLSNGYIGMVDSQNGEPEPTPMGGGVTYIRWGKTTCPQVPGTEMVYSGQTGGSFWNHTGGGANYLCMPGTVEYRALTPGVQGWSTVYGTEYKPGINGVQDGPLFPVQNHNVPCVVCDATTRGRVLMIPARIICPESWTREYYGYLMSNYHGANHYRTMFECVDAFPDTIPGSEAGLDGARFYHTEADCDGMPCPPYTNQHELTCVVCTK